MMKLFKRKRNIPYYWGAALFRVGNMPLAGINKTGDTLEVDGTVNHYSKAMDIEELEEFMRYLDARMKVNYGDAKILVCNKGTGAIVGKIKPRVTRNILGYLKVNRELHDDMHFFGYDLRSCSKPVRSVVLKRRGVK